MFVKHKLITLKQSKLKSFSRQLNKKVLGVRRLTFQFNEVLSFLRLLDVTSDKNADRRSWIKSGLQCTVHTRTQINDQRTE